MVAELASIVEAGLGIPVAAAPLRLAIGNRPGDVFLAENLLAFRIERCHVGDTGSEAILTVLAGGVFCVVRALDLEIQTRREEAHVELVLQVEVQHVGALRHITQVVVVRKGVAVVGTNDVSIGHDVPALIVNTDTGVGSGSLQIAEEEALAATHRGAVLHTSTQCQCKLAILRNVDVEVGTIVETVILERLVVILGEGLEE